MTRMTDQQEDLRAALEDAQMGLGDIAYCVRLIRKRLQLALEEGARDKLLTPCFEELDRITLKSSAAIGALTEARIAEVWANNWKEEDHAL